MSHVAGGARAIALTVDVADRASVADGFAKVRGELGPVAIIVTSAGIESFTPLLDITPEGWDRILAVNLTGTFSCVQAAVPDMLAARWGRIVTIASSSAQSGAPNMTHYAASKGGVISLTRALAVELARHGITANAITPSLVDTPMARARSSASTVACTSEPHLHGRRPDQRHHTGLPTAILPPLTRAPDSLSFKQPAPGSIAS